MIDCLADNLYLQSSQAELTSSVAANSDNDNLIYEARTLKKKKRLTREDWLQASLEMLAKFGHSHLRIDELCENLQVTKGSFYAHFIDRADFSKQLVDYWREAYTLRVMEAVRDTSDLPSRGRLLILMRLLIKQGRNRFDIPIRAWAARDSELTKIVDEVDTVRFEVVKRIFRDIGFRGAELDLRTDVFVTYFSYSNSIGARDFGSKSDKAIHRLHEFFIHEFDV